MNNTVDYLNIGESKFQPPKRESQLQQHSEKLVFSTRLFPEWLAAALGIFKQKYNQEPLPSASKAIQLIVQDYILDNYNRIDNSLPPTEPSMEFLIKQGFVNPDNKVQFRKMSKASHQAEKYQEQMMSSDNLRDQYVYWKDRDPEKANEIMQQMADQVVADMDRKPDSQKPSWKEKREQSAKEKPIKQHTRHLPEEPTGEIAGDVPDDIPLADED